MFSADIAGNYKILRKKKLSKILLLLVTVFLIISPGCSSQADEENPITLEGEVANSIEANFLDGTINTETVFLAEFEMEDNFALDIEMTNNSVSEGESISEIEIDFEILPSFRNEDIELYFETDLFDHGYNETLLGIAGTLGGADYDLGVDLREDKKNIYINMYRWFDSGISLQGGVKLGNGPVFKTSQLRFRGVPLTVKDATWDLSGKLEATLEESFFGETEHVKLSFSLENEKVELFRFPKRGEGISFYKLTPLDSGEYTVVLYNSGSKLNLKGWTIGSEGNFKEISKTQIISTEQKLGVSISNAIVESSDRLKLRNPGGKVKDTWVLPRFYFGNNELFRREGALERLVEISFEDNEFKELTADWALEVPTGPKSFYFGDLEIDHTGEIGKAEIGHREPRSELKISLLDEEIELVYYPLTGSEEIESEMGLKLNRAGEYETVFEIDQDFGNFELANALELSLDDEETELELAQELEWEQLELEFIYLFEDSDFVEFELNTEFTF
ncbi:MAG: hypothetical protein ACOC6I_02010 [Candidatus Bipolaricaulota bacterium]